MASKFISKKFQTAKATAMTKVNDIARKYDDIINLSLGDPDINTPEPIIRGAFEDARMGHTKYTDFKGDPELRDAIKDFYRDEYGIEVERKEVFIAASATLGMYLTLCAILDPGDEVILQAPFFSPYPNQVKLAGGVPVELPTYEEEDFQINISRLESLITDKTKALVICSPSNPTGNCLSMENMLEIAEIAEKHDILVISDEIYTSFSFERDFKPFISIDNIKNRTITINSFSKNFMMTGWRVGNVIAPEEIVNAITEVNDNVVFTAPSVSQRAALHALKHRKEVQPEIIDEYRKRMFFAAVRINSIPNMHVLYPPKGSFYLFINIKDTGLTSDEAVERILDEAHVLTLPGTAFGNCGEGYLRIACTLGTDGLEEAFSRIEKMSLFSKEVSQCSI